MAATTSSSRRGSAACVGGGRTEMDGEETLHGGFAAVCAPRSQNGRRRLRVTVPECRLAGLALSVPPIRCSAFFSPFLSAERALPAPSPPPPPPSATTSYRLPPPWSAVVLLDSRGRLARPVERLLTQNRLGTCAPPQEVFAGLLPRLGWRPFALVSSLCLVFLQPLGESRRQNRSRAE